MTSPTPPTRPARPPLAVAVLDPGFTPRARDLDGLVDLLADEEHAKAVRRAVGRLGASTVPRLIERFTASAPPLRARVLRVLGQFAEEPGALEVLLAALRDGDAKTRRNAAMELGHASAAGIEDALLEAWRADERVEMRRTVAASLGKVGGPRAAAVLAEAARSEDGELQRIAGKSSMMVSRSSTRAQAGRLDASRAAPSPVDVLLLSRGGLEEILADELSRVKALRDVRVAGAGVVRARLAGPLAAVFAARTLLAVRFPLPLEKAEGGGSTRSSRARSRAPRPARCSRRGRRGPCGTASPGPTGRTGGRRRGAPRRRSRAGPPSS